MARRDITVKIVVPTSGSLLSKIEPGISRGGFTGEVYSRRAPPYAAPSSDAYFFLARFALRASFFCTPAG